jgi:hypothetical protein
VTRKVTKRLLQLVEEGVIDPATLARGLLGYMSEDDVADFARANEYLADDDDEEDECPTSKP